MLREELLEQFSVVASWRRSPPEYLKKMDLKFMDMNLKSMDPQLSQRPRILDDHFVFVGHLNVAHVGDHDPIGC